MAWARGYPDDRDLPTSGSNGKTGGGGGGFANGAPARSVQVAGLANRIPFRSGIMRSFTSLICGPWRQFGAVALHNRALRIIGEG